MGIITGVNLRASTTGKDEVYLSVSRPRQAVALWGFSLAAWADHFLSQLIHNDLALQILQRCQQQQSVTGHS